MWSVGVYLYHRTTCLTLMLLWVWLIMQSTAWFRGALKISFSPWADYLLSLLFTHPPHPLVSCWRRRALRSVASWFFHCLLARFSHAGCLLLRCVLSRCALLHFSGPIGFSRFACCHVLCWDLARLSKSIGFQVLCGWRLSPGVFFKLFRTVVCDVLLQCGSPWHGL